MTPDFAICCFKWKPEADYRSQFNSTHVNILRNMVRRNFPVPHRFICITDDPVGIDRGIEIIPLWGDFANMKSPHGPRNPSCYRRLRMFHPDIGKLVGPRFVTLDLDVVIVGDMRPCWLRKEDFVIWGDTNPTTPYNGSMMLMTAGARPKVWTDFHPEETPRMTRAKGFFGSDQAWIGLCLGPGEAKWTHREGVFSYRNEIGPHKKELPLGARIIIFHGQHDPWGPQAQQLAWVRANYL